jgi:hypothetical protein
MDRKMLFALAGAVVLGILGALLMRDPIFGLLVGAVIGNGVGFAVGYVIE